MVHIGCELMNEESLLVRDMIFPLILCRQNGEGTVELVEFLGTGFLIGNKNYALTAGHVVNVNISVNTAIVAMFVGDDCKWRVQDAHIVAIHPKEDIALLLIGGDHTKKPNFQPCLDKQYSGFQYKLFGYPQVNFYENTETRDMCGRVLGRPDMIFSEGHIRRRTSWELLNIKGTQLYELSTPVGKGCSGSPIFRIVNNVWLAVGVYIADQVKTINVEHYDKNLEWKIDFIEFPGELSYATRMDAIENWQVNEHSKFTDFI